MKRFRKRLSAMLVIAMVLTCLQVPAYAGELADEDNSLIQEADNEAYLSDQSVGEPAEDMLIEDDGEMPDSLLNDETQDLQKESYEIYDDVDNTSEGMSLKSLAEQYDNDRDSASGYKIIYVSENDVSLEDDAETILEGTGNRNIVLGEDNTVTQTFDKDAEDAIAPLVYKKEGMAARGDKAWYLIYMEPFYVPGDYGYSGYREVKKYFSATAKVTDKDYDKGSKTLKDYADSDGKIRLYPNWQEPVPVSFDQVSLKEAVNPNSDIMDYVTYETLILDPLDPVMGYNFKTWQYQFEGERIKEAEEGKDELEGKFLIKTEGHKKLLTIYAVWEPARYRISYVGIKVRPVSVNEAGADTANDTINIDGTQMEVVSVDNEGPAINSDALPDFYTYDTTTVLPTAAEINEGKIDKDFSEYNRFLCWSNSRKFLYNHIITALGREGQVKYGDVTLYAVYTSRYPVPELSANNVAADKEFKAIQNTKLDLLDRDSYAVISLVGTGVSADPKTVQLEGEGTKYFELCEVDSRKAILGHGYAAIGIKLKEEVDGKTVDASAVTEIVKNKDLQKMNIKVQGIDHKTDEKGQPVYCVIPVKLDMTYKIPKYKLTAASGTMYTNHVKAGDSAWLVVSEKNGGLMLDTYGGDWVADYADKDKSTYKTVDPSDVSVSVEGDEFIVEAKSPHKTGCIRLRNTSWVEGAYTYCPYKISENKKDPSLMFMGNKIELNTEGNNETSTVRALFKGGMGLDPSRLGYDPVKSSLAEGLKVTVDKVNGTISVTRKGQVKKGSYKVYVTYDGLKKGVNLSVKVSDTKPEKAVKLRATGAIDSFAGGSMYLTPRVTGYAGTIEDVYVVESDGDKSGFDAVWLGQVIELATNDDYVPFSNKANLNLKVKLSTGVELPAVCKLKYQKGKIKVNAYTADLNVKTVSGAAVETSVSTPVIVTYNYTHYATPLMKTGKIYTVDLTREEGSKLVDVECKADSSGLASVKYERGVLTVTNKAGIDLSKPKTLKQQVRVKWKSDKQNASANCEVNISEAK